MSVVYKTLAGMALLVIGFAAGRMSLGPPQNRVEATSHTLISQTSITAPSQGEHRTTTESPLPLEDPDPSVDPRDPFLSPEHIASQGLVTFEGQIISSAEEYWNLSREDVNTINAAYKTALEAFTEVARHRTKTLSTRQHELVIITDIAPEAGAAIKAQLVAALPPVPPDAHGQRFDDLVVEALGKYTGNFGNLAQIIEIDQIGKGFKFKLRQAYNGATLESLLESEMYLDPDYYGDFSIRTHRPIPPVWVSDLLRACPTFG